MSFAGNVKLEAAKTFFIALGAGLFGSKESLYGVFTKTVPCNGSFLEVDSLGVVPAVQEINGSRPTTGLRVYQNRARVKRYGPAALEIPVLDIVTNSADIVASKLSEYLGLASNFWEKPVNDFFLSNPTGLDGVSLLNDTHPYGAAGATWDNLSSNALSPDEFKIGIAAIEGLQLENGEPAGYSPNILMVGPSNRKLGMDLCHNAMRVVPVSAAGVEAYSSAVAATAIPNSWIAGQITCVVNPRWVGTYAANWCLMDTKREDAKPIYIGEAIAPASHALIEPNTPSMIDRSCATFYAEGQLAMLGGIPFGLFGKFA
jgi:hypothetical protein